jgi:hypothetical protein
MTVKRNKPRVMVATPTQGSVKTHFMKTVIGTMGDLSKRGVDTVFETVDGVDIAQQRNVLATNFLRDASWTHLFFVDSDMMFHADLCFRMISHDKPIVGAIYASKQFDLSRLLSAMNQGMEYWGAVLSAHSWHAFLPENQGVVSIKDGLLEVNAIGFGATLIQRSALERMVESGAANATFSQSAQAFCHNFFSPRPKDVAAGVFVPEDISFCNRWRLDVGGTLFAVVDATIYHIGDYGYGGAYLSLLQAAQNLHQKQPADAPKS